MTATQTATRLTGHDAIEHADAHGLDLSKYADPVEDAREVLTVSEARAVASEDPGLIYLDIATEATEPLTNDMIADLRREAADAGDTDQVSSCDAALRDDYSSFSRAQCAETITAARAMDDETAFVRVVA